MNFDCASRAARSSALELWSAIVRKLLNERLSTVMKSGAGSFFQKPALIKAQSKTVWGQTILMATSLYARQHGSRQSTLLNLT